MQTGQNSSGNGKGGRAGEGGGGGYDTRRSHGVHALEGQELVVRAQLLHSPAVEHGDLVGIPDGGQTVCHCKRRALLLRLELVQRRLHLIGDREWRNGEKNKITSLFITGATQSPLRFSLVNKE